MKKFLAAVSIACMAMTGAAIAPSLASTTSSEPAWKSLGSQLGSALDGDVRDVVKGPDGNIYATGNFDDAGGVPEADVIAMWDGTSWSALGSNGNGDGFFDNGTGFAIAWNPEGDLILGGAYLVSDQDTNDQALFSWDGTSWTNLGQDKFVSGDGIRDVEVDASGTIYFGGPFGNVNGVDQIDNLGKLSEGVFSALLSSGATQSPITNHVLAIELDESGNVFVAGKFRNAGGIPQADALAKWNVTTETWSSLDSNQAGTDGYFSPFNDAVVNDMILIDGDLYIASNGWAPSGSVSGEYGIFVFDGTDITRVIGEGKFSDRIWSLDYDFETNSLLVAGWFLNYNSMPFADGVFSYDLDNGNVTTFGEAQPESDCCDYQVFNVTYLGGGDIVFAGGFENWGDSSDNDNLAIWDSSVNTWIQPGNTVHGAFTNEVYGVEVGPDGNYYATGCFTDVGGVPAADKVAMWDGTSWSALGSDGNGDGFFSSSDYWDGCGFSIAWNSDGDLILAGKELRGPGETTDQALYKWDGTQWTNLAPNKLQQGSGLRDILVNDDGTIYVAGPVTNMGGNALADFVALWDNGNFVSLGSNGSGGAAINYYAFDLEKDDAGNLFASGKFQNAGGVPEADFVAKWDGVSWSALGSNGTGNGYFERYGDTKSHALKWHDGTLYIGVDEFLNVVVDDMGYQNRGNGYGVYAYSNGSMAVAIAPGILNDQIRGLDYDTQNDRLIVAGRFENANDDPLADGVVSVNLDTGDVFAYGEALDPDNVVNGADHRGEAHAVKYVGNGQILYAGQFRNLNNNPLADYLAMWGVVLPGADNAPQPGSQTPRLAATGSNVELMAWLAIAAVLSTVGGLSLRRRRI